MGRINCPGKTFWPEFFQLLSALAPFIQTKISSKLRLQAGVFLAIYVSSKMVFYLGTVVNRVIRTIPSISSFYRRWKDARGE